MAIKFIQVKCPACGGEVVLQQDTKEAFCTHCRAQLLLDNDHEFVYKNIKRDEADIIRAETERMVKMKQLEKEEREAKEEQIENEKKRKIKIILGASTTVALLLAFSSEADGLYVIAIFLCFAFLMQFPNNPNNKDLDLDDYDDDLNF